MPPRGLTPLCEKVYNGEDDIQELMEEKDTADEVSRAPNVPSPWVLRPAVRVRG